MDGPDFHPPPVPPKDTPRKYKMPGNFSSAHTSASKRKRQDDYDEAFSEDELAQHTPKRHRLTPEPEASEPSAQRQNALRRKKGVNNLSHLNLRHKAEQARLKEQAPRESRFQEGSLTDKPSQKPPSTFMRVMSNDSDSVDNVDSLMADYHDGMPTSGESTAGTDNAPKRRLCRPDQPPGGFWYRVSHRIASVFGSGDAWKESWLDTKEELWQKNIDTLRAKLEKEEAEKKYAELKAAGKIPIKKSSFAFLGGFSQRDSGIEMMDDSRASSAASYIPPFEEAASRTETTELQDQDAGQKTIRGRLQLLKPSFSNMRTELKRARSDMNLFGISNRDSGSVSPVKDDTTQNLRKAHSRVDLKKHNKLSKRVSDLEMKLHVARQELDQALVDASPMPKLGSKFERFTPVSTVKGKFMRSVLPTLPSESLLKPEMFSSNSGVEDRDATIRASRANAYPRRAAEVFDEQPTDISSQDQHDEHYTPQAINPSVEITDELSGPVSTYNNHNLREASIESIEEYSFEEPDAMGTPDASESSANPIERQARSKKRKSNGLDIAYKPGRVDSDDDAEFGYTKKTVKKRKSNITNAPKRAKHNGDQADMEGETQAAADPTVVDEHTDIFQHYADELRETAPVDRDASIRLSIDSTSHSLEPVYEEEEEISIIPINDDPAKPTAKATPARFGRAARSRSPRKRVVQAAAAEEVVITRAAHAAQQHPGRIARSRTPVKQDDEYEWPADVF